MPQTLVRPSQINGVAIGDNLGVLLKADNTEATFSNSSAENQYYSFSVPGGTIGANDALEIAFFGSLLNNSGAAPNYTFRLKYGGTTLLTMVAASVQANATAFGYVFRAILKNAGATNSQKSAGGVMVASYTSAALEYTAQGTSAIDSMVAQSLVFTIQSSSAVATQTLAQYFAILNYLKAT